MGEPNGKLDMDEERLVMEEAHNPLETSVSLASPTGRQESTIAFRQLKNNLALSIFDWEFIGNGPANLQSPPNPQATNRTKRLAIFLDKAIHVRVFYH